MNKVSTKEIEDFLSEKYKVDEVAKKSKVYINFLSGSGGDKYFNILIDTAKFIIKVEFENDTLSDLYFIDKKTFVDSSLKDTDFKQASKIIDLSNKYKHINKETMITLANELAKIMRKEAQINVSSHYQSSFAEGYYIDDANVIDKFAKSLETALKGTSIDKLAKYLMTNDEVKKAVEELLNK